MANLKRSKVRIVSFFLSFFIKPAWHHNVIHVAFETATNTVVLKFSGNGSFELSYERNWYLLLKLFVGTTQGQSVLAARSHSSVHMCEDDASTASMWAALCNKLLLDFYQKRTETSLHKKFLKRNLAIVGMAQCMNALADKVYQQEVPCTQWYAVHTMATLFNNHPYISSSKFSANWRATATYVGIVVELCGHVMECISLCAWHFLFFYYVSQCIHALNHPYKS